jgi:nitroreductase
MDALECIQTRRSVRKYEDREVPGEYIEKLLDAAMTAPSACDQRPWHFVVVTDRSILDRIPEFSPHAKMVRDAPMGILVCADPSLEKCKDYWVQDCSNATMNILTAVRALGLGAVWTGVYPREDRVEGFRALLDVPEGLAPFSFIVIGRPAEEQGRRDRYDPSRVHYNGW